MNSVSEWIQERPFTVGLSVFFISWYAFQLFVLHTYGDSFARWLFYTELPPRVTGGLLFSPLSHDLYDLKHIGANVALLLGVGGLAEPYIGKWKVPGLIVVGGYVGMVVTMLSAPVLEFWPMAGASSGILILWGYSGLRLWNEFGFSDDLSPERLEEHGTLFLVNGIPLIPAYELLVTGNMSHAIGMVLGVAYFWFETSRSG